MKPTRRLAILFAKPAIPGRVKTRLIGALSAAHTAAFQQAFTADLWRRLQRGDFTSVMAWALEAGEELPAEPGPGWAQRGVDLGERIHHALEDALQVAGAALVVGSDHPDLPAARLETAFRWLESGTDIVLGPSLDGGFYLIAARRGAPAREILRHVRWSGADTLRDVLHGCARARRTVRLLPAASDVDCPADFERLAARIRSGELTDCPSTAALIAELAAAGQAPLGSAAGGGPS